MGTSDRTVGEIVADDYRTATVFADHGIDFCCAGSAALAATCTAKGIDLATMTKELDAVRSEPNGRAQTYASWELPFLADYILNAHHTYLRENTGQLAAYAHKIAGVHGDHHPEVVEIAAVFDKMATGIAAHLREEEDVLFPAVTRVDATRRAGAQPDADDRRTVKASLAKLSREHEEIGDAVHAIRRLAKGYFVPGDVCNTFMVTYQRLKEFEADLHKHVHLENNILFPKAALL